MDCEQVKLMLSALLDGRVLDSERREMKDHLSACPGCALQYEQFLAVRSSLRALRESQIPDHVKMSLRVVASREAHRRRMYAGLRGWVRQRAELFQLTVNNLMRPLALPAAGGLMSAVFLFSMVLTNYHGIQRQPVDDVPTILATAASMKTSLFLAEELNQELLNIDVLVDEQGRAIEYRLPTGASPELRRRIGNSLLFTRFEPATAFGQPTPSWVRLSYRRIDVRG